MLIATKQLMDHYRNQTVDQKIHRDKWKWEHKYPKPMGHSKSCFKREVYSDAILPQQIKISNKQPNLMPKATRERKSNSKVHRK